MSKTTHPQSPYTLTFQEDCLERCGAVYDTVKDLSPAIKFNVLSELFTLLNSLPKTHSDFEDCHPSGLRFVAKAIFELLGDLVNQNCWSIGDGDKWTVLERHGAALQAARELVNIMPSETDSGMYVYRAGTEEYIVMKNGVADTID